MTPDTFRSYNGPVRRALWLASLIEVGTLAIIMPDGSTHHFGGKQPGPAAEIRILDLEFARWLSRGGDIGIADAYIAGMWETPDLTAFLMLFAANQPVMQRLLQDRPLVRALQRFQHFLNRNSRRGARRNIHAHYDLGNGFYGAWLDPDMNYSSALYETPHMPLAQAQKAKQLALARGLGLSEGQHLLEIGCGWGGFALFAAQTFGCAVTALTISQAQFDVARQRVFAAGLNEKVKVELRDYRDETGVYDAIASIEMIEAVGEAYWPKYFAQLSGRLRPGGRAGLQAITIDEALFAGYRRDIDFIRRHIFPGGMLPTLSRLRALGARVNLDIIGERAFGPDYARTLAQWRDRFRAAWPQIAPGGFDEPFRRMWEYYLSYCEAGFTVGTINVRQIFFEKPR
ncbi:MAG: cyclopropane-fatty-acyl-phospholipid synthase family protein [Hyphomicrobiales bacterium]|nr:cyclopropane-fatty-acyl-phospholipid synthase family protein [Hyphomicrobiales bacterium]